MPLRSGIELIDTHCHLDMSAYAGDLDKVMADAREVGVNHVITIGISPDSSIDAVNIAQRRDDVSATVGIHPHDAASATPAALDMLADLAQKEKVVGYGEIGLDYVKKYAPIDVQKKAFAAQLGLARELELPVVIHDREAHDDALQLIREAGPFPAGGVMHCFSGDITLAEKVIDLGFYISIPGIVTFKNARTLHEVVRKIGIQHILLETDGPFLAPVPFRGKRNTPDKMIYTAEKVAALKDISLEEAAERTTRNAERLFRLNKDITQ